MLKSRTVANVRITLFFNSSTAHSKADFLWVSDRIRQTQSLAVHHAAAFQSCICAGLNHHCRDCK